MDLVKFIANASMCMLTTYLKVLENFLSVIICFPRHQVNASYATNLIKLRNLTQLPTFVELI